MKDAGFYVPSDKRDRFAHSLHDRAHGELIRRQRARGAAPSTMQHEPTMPSGGGGMVSTAADYYRFAQMLLNGGQLDGTRILAPATVKLDDLQPRSGRAA